MILSKTTIGMTCYNAEDTIVRAIESGLAQEYPDFEIVIVDDCSTDKSWDILQNYAHANQDKIRVLKNEKNLGVAGTRNRIIAEARGEFLAFFDDDDVSAPDRIMKQVNRIIACERSLGGSSPIICHTARLQKYPDGTEKISPTMGCDENVLSPHGRDMAARILYNKKINGGNGAIATCSQMARTETYRRVGGFDEMFRRMEDTEFNVRLALAGGYFVGIADPLVVQTMTQSEDKIITSERFYARQLYKKHHHFLEEEGRNNFDIKWLEAKHDFWENKKVKFIIRLAGLFFCHPLLSIERLIHSLPNMEYNQSVRKFHRGSE